VTYRFIDLFAGIGGFHLAFHNAGAECVFASEWDKEARKTYEENLSSISPELFSSGNFVGDITKVEKSSIPDFDILTGGFPCQPFSQAVVKASDHGLPQLRPRLFMIGFRNPSLLIEQPKKRELAFTMSDVMKGNVPREIGFTLRVGGRGSGVGDRRNWDSYLVDGTERRLTPDEGKTMQGFPKDFKFPVSTTSAMKQLGNSVAVWAIQDYAEEILRVLREEQ
jgi:site-specific DNA-cytosine methylase